MEQKMNQGNSLINAVSFEYLLLDCYSKLGLSENELVVCLMIEHLSKQGNAFVNSDMLALKMNLSTKEIDESMASLLQKGFLVYDHDEDNKLIISLLPLKEEVKKEFAFSLTREQTNSMNKEREENMTKLVSLFEEKFARTLAPLEISTITDWLDNGYGLDDIKNALLDALNQNKKNIRAVNKILVNRRKQDDIQKEGASAVSDRWDKSVEETIQAAKNLWGDAHDK
ncbi:MAG TPA: hypothetical protein DDW18_02800 [Firmicutes bacterium]|nr:hypothetical protein [Bacillota bacterium]